MKQHCPIVVCLKDSKTGKFTNCGPTLCPDSKNLHLPNGYSAPPGNNGVNWLGVNPHQPNGAIGYNVGVINSHIPNHSIGSHSAAQNIARIATDKDFAATCHGGIAVDSLISHTVAQNATGKGINAVASLQAINLGFNNLNDSDILKLNNGLLGYTLNLKVLHLNNNNFSNTGLDYLIKGPAGIQYLQAGGTDKPFIMQGLFTHYNVNMTQINLSNNQLTDVGASIISHALVTGSLPHLKALDVSGNQITPTGYGHFVNAIKATNQKISIVFESVVGYSKEALKMSMKAMLSVAKANGISTKEILTTQETIEHCKKGLPNVVKNIIWGGITCNTKLGTAVDIASLNLLEIMKDLVIEVFNPLKKPYAFMCTSQEVILSVVDEDFSNCLTGVESLMDQ